MSSGRLDIEANYLPGSGQGEMVLAEAGLDGDSQYRAVKSYLESLPS